MKLRNLIPSVGLLIVACASGGGGSAMYQREIGNASGSDTFDRARLVINRFHYEIAEQDSIPYIRIETYWRPRQPFADEQALGITDAESRIVVTARIRGESELGSIYNIRLALENRVRVAGSPDWNETTNTPEFRQYADGIVQNFKQELTNIGVRRFGGDACCAP